MVTTRPPKTIVKPTALGPVANTDTKLLIYGLFQKGRVLAQDGVSRLTDHSPSKPRSEALRLKFGTWTLLAVSVSTKLCYARMGAHKKGTSNQDPADIHHLSKFRSPVVADRRRIPQLIRGVGATGLDELDSDETRKVSASSTDSGGSARPIDGLRDGFVVFRRRVGRPGGKEAQRCVQGS